MATISRPVAMQKNFDHLWITPAYESGKTGSTFGFQDMYLEKLIAAQMCKENQRSNVSYVWKWMMKPNKIVLVCFQNEK